MLSEASLDSHTINPVGRQCSHPRFRRVEVQHVMPKQQVIASLCTCWGESSVLLAHFLPPVKQQGLWLSIPLKATAFWDRITRRGIQWRPGHLFSREHLDCKYIGSAPSKLRRQLNPPRESRKHASPRLSRCLSGTAKNFSRVKKRT